MMSSRGERTNALLQAIEGVKRIDAAGLEFDDCHEAHEALSDMAHEYRRHIDFIADIFASGFYPSAIYPVTVLDQ